MKARQSSVTVLYNGNDITKTITDYIESFQYVDHASGTADTVTLKRKVVGKLDPRSGGLCRNNYQTDKLEEGRRQPEI